MGATGVSGCSGQQSAAVGVGEMHPYRDLPRGEDAGLAPRVAAGPWLDLAAACDICSANWLGPDDIAARAAVRLDQLLESARTRTAFYRRLHAASASPMAGANVPRDAAARIRARLSALPAVQRSALMASFDDTVADAALDRASVERFIASPSRLGTRLGPAGAVWTSSGTTGEPGVYLHDDAALAVYDALQLYRFRGCNSPLEAGLRLSTDGPYALVAATGGHFAGAASLARLQRRQPWLADRLHCISLMQPLPRIVAALQACGPRLLATYPSAAAVLADEQQAGRLRLSLEELWLGGERLGDGLRARLARVFGARVRQEYGASEFPSIAADCARGRLHLNADWALLEAVDAQGRPVEPGVSSASALLTNLANRLQPLIRYDLGDAVRIDPSRCACGSPLPVVEVQGRSDDTLRFDAPDGAVVSLLPLVLATILEEQAGVYGFQLAAVGADAIALRLAPPEHAAAERARAALRAHLDAMALAPVRVLWDGEEPRRSRRSAKLQRVVDERAAQAAVRDEPRAG